MNFTHRTYRITLSVLLAALLVAACQPQTSEPKPPDIAYGQDVCDECSMLISEARFAAATLVEKGDPHKFDSIGDMIAYHMERPDQTVRAWFVHDYNSQAWIRGETAVYVLSDQVHSPMPPGLAAFEKRAEAETFASSVGAQVMDFDEMRAAVHMAVHG